MDSLRIDKWLWATRFFKTRSLAAQAVAAGRVQVNGQRAKPARLVQEGDLLELALDACPRQLRVLGVPRRRGPAPEAAGFYRETEESAQRHARFQEQSRFERLTAPRFERRPDKRQRRQLSKLKGRET